METTRYLTGGAGHGCADVGQPVDILRVGGEWYELDRHASTPMLALYRWIGTGPTLYAAMWRQRLPRQRAA